MFYSVKKRIFKYYKSAIKFSENINYPFILCGAMTQIRKMQKKEDKLEREAKKYV